jgi:hypothetical protein
MITPSSARVDPSFALGRRCDRSYSEQTAKTMAHRGTPHLQSEVSCVQLETIEKPSAPLTNLPVSASRLSRVPDNLALAVGALIVGIVTPIVSASLLAASGGRFWVSLGAPVCAIVAVVRSRRARFGSATTGLDVRHGLSEGVRSMAILTLLYSGGVLALNGATLAFAAGGP